jgi:hypothetical protein
VLVLFEGELPFSVGGGSNEFEGSVAAVSGIFVLDGSLVDSNAGLALPIPTGGSRDAGRSSSLDGTGRRRGEGSSVGPLGDGLAPLGTATTGILSPCDTGAGLGVRIDEGRARPSAMLEAD